MPRFSLPLLWLRPLVIGVVILGVFFRFVNIDQKVFWHDEIYTGLRISGYHKDKPGPKIFTGQIINIADLQKYQEINSNRNITDTIISLAKEEPHHPPLYYILTRIWAQLWGNSVASLRTPSIIISLLVFPLSYWLCWELFHSSLVAWLTVTFFAISPFQVLYAQEAREYSLCMVMILLTNLTLLLAIRRNNISSWIIYSLSLTVSYYTSIFTIPVAIGQGVYTLIQNKFKPNQVTINHFLAGLISIVLFVPWLWVIIQYKESIDKTNAWITGEVLSWKFITQFWGLNIINNISNNFIDIFLNLSSLKSYIIPLIYTLFLAYAIYFLIKTTEQQIWLLLIYLLLSPILYLIVPDILAGGIRSLISRYYTPWYTAIPIIFAYLIAQKISQYRVVKQRLWQGIFLVMISLSIISCTAISQADHWWNKSTLGKNVLQAAKVINQVAKPLVISDLTNQTNFGDAIALSYRVNQQTKFQLFTTPDIPTISPGFSNVFLYAPSNILLDKFRAKHGAESIKTFEGTTLLELKDISLITNK